MSSSAAVANTMSVYRPNNTPMHEQMANAIRALTLDAVEQARSGHVGMPLGMADVATVLFGKFMKFDPKNPTWPDRDRFVASAGHGSMLLYALAYLTGYEKITLDEIRNFRQIGAHTPGHPEVDLAAGIETTTGPLGQGITTAVGMAMAEKMLAARYGAEIVDHYTYVIAGDGCLMEGICQEAITMAGHWQLNKLIVFFDDNSISIDGKTDLTTSEDIPARFVAAGWHVLSIDAHDAVAIENAIAAAKKSAKPTMIACKSEIGFGIPGMAGTHKAHGGPLGAETTNKARAALGYDGAAFSVPDDVVAAWRGFGAKGGALSSDWAQRLAALPADKRTAFQDQIDQKLPANLGDLIKGIKDGFIAQGGKMATRKASGLVLDGLVDAMPELIGGSADLTGSVNTLAKGMTPITAKTWDGRYIHYGVREHAMAAVMNGMALHRGFIPYAGTFLVFSDYCRPAIRLSALMEQRVIYVFTHDSIGLGEDGPTHQPIEHLWALRGIPNLSVYRPADAVEVAECWELALRNTHGPSILALSRQDLPLLRGTPTSDNLSAKGGYRLIDGGAGAQYTLIATGSEVSIAVEAQTKLSAKGIAAHVVSMPCTRLFDQQTAEYRRSVIDPATKCVAIEAGITQGWYKYVGAEGQVFGIDGFGASAPYQKLYEKFGLTADVVVKTLMA